MEIRALKPYLTVIGLMALACLALAFGVDVTLVDQPGVRMTLPAQLGDWTGHELRFCHTQGCQKEYNIDELKDPNACPACGGKLHSMSLPEYEQLPKDTQFVKSRYTRSGGRDMFVSIVLSGTEQNSSLHRPQRCLVGQGFTIMKSYVLPVPLGDNKTMGVMLLDNVKTGRTLEGLNYEFWSYYAYWFIGKDRETPKHGVRMFWQAWDRVFRSVAHKWAYVAVSGQMDKGSDQYQDELKQAIAQLRSQIVLFPPR